MRTSARSVVQTTVVAIMTAIVALILGVTQTLTTAITASIGLTAVQALIVPGTGTPNPQPVQNYMQNARDYYLIPSRDCPDEADCELVPVPYIAQFWPIPLEGWGGLEGAKWNVSVQSGVDSLNHQLSLVPEGEQVAIFGYSQGATVVSIVKGQMDDPENTTFFLIGNPQRPDGGLFERFALLGNVPILDAQFGIPTPTDTCDVTGPACATDFALTYDGVVDFPEWILNPLAILNAVAGFQYVHGTYLAPKGDDEPPPDAPYGYEPGEVETLIAAAEEDCTAATYCQRHGDTIYITLPARYLPIYQPFVDLAEATGTSAVVIPVVDLVSPVTQTLIETAYTRDDYGVPSPVTLLPQFNPIQVASDLVNDVPEGINMALEPGRTPLPGSPPLPTETTLTDTTETNVLATEAPELLPDSKPLTRLSLFAKPGEGITTPDGTKSERPLRAALGDVHPVRDAVNAVSGAVKTVLGREDDAGTTGSDAPESPED